MYCTMGTNESVSIFAISFINFCRILLVNTFYSQIFKLNCRLTNRNFYLGTGKFKNKLYKCILMDFQVLTMFLF